MHLVHKYLNNLCRIKSVINVIAIQSATTSKSKYWGSGKSRAGDRRCAAPLCLNTYSIQYTPISSGGIGLSRNISRSFKAFSLYLKDKYKKSMNSIIYHTIMVIRLSL